MGCLVPEILLSTFCGVNSTEGETPVAASLCNHSMIRVKGKLESPFLSPNEASPWLSKNTGLYCSSLSTAVGCRT